MAGGPRSQSLLAGLRSQSTQEGDRTQEAAVGGRVQTLPGSELRTQAKRTLAYAKGVVINTPTDLQAFFPGNTITISGTVDSPEHLDPQAPPRLQVWYNGSYNYIDATGGVWTTSARTAVLGATVITVIAYYDDATNVSEVRNITVIAA